MTMGIRLTIWDVILLAMEASMGFRALGVTQLLQQHALKFVGMAILQEEKAVMTKIRERETDVILYVKSRLIMNAAALLQYVSLFAEMAM